MTTLLTIDPGAQTGWALWRDGKLATCSLGILPIADIEQAWIECPVVYPHSPARPNDLIKLARLVGRYEQICEDLGAEVHVISPADWKGELLKEISNAKTWALLTGREKELFEQLCGKLPPSKRHNVLDAIGIGLWVLRRK